MKAWMLSLALAAGLCGCVVAPPRVTIAPARPRIVAPMAVEPVVVEPAFVPRYGWR